ncbi:hypothetical protein [Roseateles sp.]|uniref:hypothetical protein n=1 Tax=Roseateles sp. TaxID=1971397 RepID=UPI0025D02FEA|nr:hypothetical protein [Roseateles sp.]MBV8037350.1 hypothetical protein [Roseateles sp.]
MKVEVQPVYEKGKGIRARERASMPKYRGLLRVHEQRVHELGRIATIAALVSSTDGTEQPLLPSLHDANLLYVNGTQLRLRGVELVDEVQYAQTWDVKVV